MTRERFAVVAQYYDGRVLNSEHLSCCWIPRDLCQRWFDFRRLPLPPWLAPSPATPVLQTQEPMEYSSTEAPGSNPPAVAYDADPKSLPLWLTAMQAVAWVCTRNFGAVWRADLERGYQAPLDLPDDFVDEWFPSGTGLTLLTLDAWHGADQGQSPWLLPSDPALEGVVDHLRAGELRSSAVNQEGERRTLDPAD